MNWFRVYNDARNDAKLRTLSDTQFRVWFNLLCLASEQAERGIIVDYDLDLLAIEVAGGDDDLLRSTIKQLVRLRILCDDGSDLSFIHFLERQYDKPSDYPQAVRERVTRHRATPKAGDVTPLKRDVTHIQEKIREEEIREESINVGAEIAPDDFDLWFDNFWQQYPKKVRKQAASRAGRRIAVRDRPQVMKAVMNYVKSDKVLNGYVKEPQGFLNDEYWRDYVAGPLNEARSGGNGNGSHQQKDAEVSKEERIRNFRPGLRDILEKRAAEAREH